MTRTDLETGREFYHLLGLDVVKAVDSSDTVSDWQHSPRLLQVCLTRLPENSVLQDGWHLGWARYKNSEEDTAASQLDRAAVIIVIIVSASSELQEEEQLTTAASATETSANTAASAWYVICGGSSGGGGKSGSVGAGGSI